MPVARTRCRGPLARAALPVLLALLAAAGLGDADIDALFARRVVA